MARAEKAWDRFTDEIVNEDDYLIRLAECLIIGYAGNMNFLQSVKKWYKKNGEITTAQARAVLNIYMTDRNYAMPLMMALNFGVESPSRHILTKQAIADFASTMVKRTGVEQAYLKNSFANITMEDVREAAEIDTEGRIFPKSWKVNVERKRSRTSDALGRYPRSREESLVSVHGIHTDSWIKDNQYNIVSVCGLYRFSIPDPFEMHSFTDKEIDCNKCIAKMNRRAEESS